MQKFPHFNKLDFIFFTIFKAQNPDLVSERQIHKQAHKRGLVLIHTSFSSFPLYFLSLSFPLPPDGSVM